MGRLKNKAAVITGGAGDIGFATAKQFVKEGAKVMLVDINEEALKKCSAEIGENSNYMVADVSNEDQVNSYTKKAVELFGKIDIAILNAGITGPYKPMIEYKAKEFDQLMAVNLRGVWLGLKAAVCEMMDTGGGSITLTSSTNGHQGAPCYGPYAASKHAIVGLMRSAAIEYAEYGIRVNTVHPGFVDTQMTRSFKKLKQKIENIIPLKQYVDPKDVANLFLFLSSDDSKLITGSCHTIDGGLTSGLLLPF